MKKILVAAVLLFGLTACGSVSEEDLQESDVITNTIQVPVKGTDRTVTCIVYTHDEYSEGGIECNWDAFNKAETE